MEITVQLPTDVEKDILFPLKRPAPPQGVFELGLILGGTVSTAAYTAGALDCLLEVLENWHQDAPAHKVLIPIVAGASGGAISAAILGLTARRKIPPIQESVQKLLTSDAPTGNPFWDIWVNSVDGKQFLSTADIGDGDLMSLLNTGLIDQTCEQMVRFAQTQGSELRPYFPTPYRMVVTLTNLRGIPYALDVPGFETWTGASYVSHDDFARFAIANGADPSAPPNRGGKRPDEFWIDPNRMGSGDDYVGYQTMIDYAVASGAFPVGLSARNLERPARHYAYRPYVRPKLSGAVVELPQPDWQEILSSGSAYPFVAVDGGVFNNDPIRLVHQALAGMAGENPRDPDKANRALFMIDPLAAKPRQYNVSKDDLISVIGTLVGAVKEGARYLTADMALIADKNVFSRFQLVPSRTDLGKIGEAALATDILDAFGGFFCRAFRVHDFLLGQINMRNYLRTMLILRGDNQLFARWNVDNRIRWAVDKDGKRVTVTKSVNPASYFLPIIPDTTYPGTGPLAVEPNRDLLPWPWKALDPEELRKLIHHRVDAVLTKLREQEMPGFTSWLLGSLLEPLLATDVTDKVINDFRKSLADQGLWPK